MMRLCTKANSLALSKMTLDLTQGHFPRSHQCAFTDSRHGFYFLQKPRSVASPKNRTSPEGKGLQSV